MRRVTTFFVNSGSGKGTYYCDGFTGNVALKTLEGTIRAVQGALRLQLPVSQDALTAIGYHAITQGYLVGEVVRRVAGGHGPAPRGV